MKDLDRSPRILVAGALFLWGAGIIALGIAVRSGALHTKTPIFYALGFVVSGAACLVLAAFLARSGS